MANSVRAGGVLKIAIGAIGSALLWVLVKFIGRHGYQIQGPGAIVLGVPGAYALMGLLEVVTGVEFTRIARKWDELAGWQRGVLGLLVVAAAIPVIFGVVFVVFG